MNFSTQLFISHLYWQPQGFDQWIVFLMLWKEPSNFLALIRSLVQLIINIDPWYLRWLSDLLNDLGVFLIIFNSISNHILGANRTYFNTCSRYFMPCRLGWYLLRHCSTVTAREAEWEILWRAWCSFLYPGKGKKKKGNSIRIWIRLRILKGKRIEFCCKHDSIFGHWRFYFQQKGSRKIGIQISPQVDNWNHHQMNAIN